MNLDKEKLINAMEHWNSNDFRKLQTQLTKTANSIEENGLHRQIQGFLSESEKNTLKESVNLLRSIKYKVQHAKEVKAREEKNREKKIAAQTEKAYELLKNSISNLSLTDKVSLCVNFRDCGWPYGELSSVQKKVDTNNYDELFISINIKLNGWIRETSDQLGWNAVGSKYFKPVPINQDCIDREIEKVTSPPIGIESIMTDIETAQLANNFIKNINSNIN